MHRVNHVKTQTVWMTLTTNPRTAQAHQAQTAHQNGVLPAQAHQTRTVTKMLFHLMTTNNMNQLAQLTLMDYKLINI